VTLKFKFLRIANRLTGISTPVFGASWKPPELDVDVANELVTFLEDRRMLTVPYAWENSQYVIESVMQTRAELTKTLSRVDRESPLSESVRAMRAACRKFLTQAVPPHNASREDYARTGAQISDPVGRGNLTADLGELRGIFGVHIARICTAYGIDVEEDPAKILPEDPALDDLRNP
jgi:Family of unknown function (DUF6650)